MEYNLSKFKYLTLYILLQIKNSFEPQEFDDHGF